MRKAVFVVGIALGVCGCAPVATVKDSKTSTPPGDTDIVKMASVNQWALTKGAVVVWIHYPTKAPGLRDDGSSAR